MILLVEDIIDSLYDRGIRQFVLLNGHIWNSGSLDVSAEKLRVRHPRCASALARLRHDVSGPGGQRARTFRARPHARELL